MRRSPLFRLGFAASAWIVGAGGVTAQPATPPDINTVAAPATTGKTDENVTAAAPSIQTILGPYGDPGGIRAYLESKGITYDITYIGEVFGNPTGGLKQNATYEGRVDVNLNLDLEKLASIKGLAAHAEAFQIHGRGLTGNNLLNLLTVSGIEASPDTKLYEAWFEDTLPGGKVAIRAGQLAADTEFVISQTAAVFINSTYGWPGSFGNNLPSGGPAYPLATPGLRVKASINDNLTLLAAIFNGDPAGAYQPNLNAVLPQLRDPGGVAFRISDPPFVIGEAQYSYNQGKDPAGLPGIVKIGYFHHFEQFLAANQPFNPGVTYGGDDGVYAVVDQTIYREKEHPEQGAAAFVRATYDPGDRNLVDLYVDGGLSYKGLIPGRADDTVGIGAAYARISPDLAASDVVLGAAPLIRDYEALVEATYQYAVAPGFTVQPDVQYIFHPSAHAVGYPDTGQPLHNAAVFGLRATVHY